MFDIIGDIHDYCSKLEKLLKKLQYKKTGKCWKHQERKVIFLGDYIDRGPEIRETLTLVRNMIEAGNAIALMGNHEFNALAYHSQNDKNGFLREHNETHTHQHSIEKLNKILKNGFIWEILQKATDKNDKFYLLFEEVLKGKEISLPEGFIFYDKEGIKRKEIRVQWWMDPAGLTYHQYSVQEIPGLENTIKIKEKDFTCKWVYPYLDKPVFFGHYWLQGRPALVKENICCLDFSVAKKGYLAAYRWNGEKKLLPEHFVYV